MKKGFLETMTAALVSAAAFIPRFFRAQTAEKYPEKNMLPLLSPAYDPSIVTPLKKCCLLCGRTHYHNNAFCCGNHARIYRGILSVVRKFKKGYNFTGSNYQTFFQFDRDRLAKRWRNVPAFIDAVKKDFPRIVIPETLG
jgi:hypothetical protein